MSDCAGLTGVPAIAVVPAAALTPPPSLLTAPPEHVRTCDRPDPLRAGFLLAGGVLAPLPERVRLPHEDDPGEDVLV